MTRDLPERLLRAAARSMSPSRAYWGRAMIAELSVLRDPASRWEFALGCTFAAVFTQGELMSRLAIGTLVSVVFTGPLILLELRNASARFPYPLFALLALVPMAAVLVGAPVVRVFREGGRFARALPGALFVLLAIAVWATVVSDQMPCFLGAPACD